MLLDGKPNTCEFSARLRQTDLGREKAQNMHSHPNPARLRIEENGIDVPP